MKPGAGQLDEGLVLAQGHRVGFGGDVADPFAGAGGVGGEGEDGLDLGVLGEGAGAVERDGGAGGIDLVGALLGACEGRGDVVGVAEEEVGGVDEDGAFRAVGGGIFGLYLEAGEDRLGEGLAYGELLGGVVGGGAEHLVGLDEQHLGADALEAYDATGGGLAAIEADVVGAGAVGQRVGVEEVLVEVGNLEVELAGLGIPVERKQAGHVLHGGGPGGDGGQMRVGLCCGFLSANGGECREKHGENEHGAHATVVARDPSVARSNAWTGDWVEGCTLKCTAGDERQADELIRMVTRMNILMIPVLGMMTGLRTFTPITVACWFAYLGYLPVEGTWAGWAGKLVAVVIFTLLALAELVADKWAKIAEPHGSGTAGGAAGLWRAGGCDCGHGSFGLGGRGRLAGRGGRVAGSLRWLLVRKSLVQWSGRPDWNIAVIEDASAIVISIVALGVITG